MKCPEPEIREIIRCPDPEVCVIHNASFLKLYQLPPEPVLERPVLEPPFTPEDQRDCEHYVSYSEELCKWKQLHSILSDSIREHPELYIHYIPILEKVIKNIAQTRKSIRRYLDAPWLIIPPGADLWQF